MIECVQSLQFSWVYVLFQLSFGEPQSYLDCAIQLPPYFLLCLSVMSWQGIFWELDLYFYTWYRNGDVTTCEYPLTPLSPRFLRSPFRRFWKITVSYLHVFQANKKCSHWLLSFPLHEVIVPLQANLCLRSFPGSNSSSERNAFWRCLELSNVSAEWNLHLSKLQASTLRLLLEMLIDSQCLWTAILETTGENDSLKALRSISKCQHQ